MKYLAMLLCLVAGAASAGVGTVVGLEGQGEILGANGRRPAVVSAEVFQGDVLKTGNGGTIQVLLTDDTKFVVGPGTEISIDVATIGQNNSTFNNLAVGITAGTMRFLSGDSNKNAYNVNTPASSMGIRGTVFDIVVEGRSDNYVVFDGSVRLCRGRNTALGACAILEDTCTVATVSQSEIVAKPDQQRELRKFSLIYNQDRLLPAFRADTSKCGNASVVDRGGSRVAPSVAPPAPAPAQPDVSPPAPEAPSVSPGRGNGNSSNTNGRSGESQGRGAADTPGNQGGGGNNGGKGGGPGNGNGHGGGVGGGRNK